MEHVLCQKYGLRSQFFQHQVKHAIVNYVEYCSECDWNVGKHMLPYMLKILIVILITDYTVRSKGSRTEFFTAFLPMPSTGPRLNYIVETVSHKSANWR